MCDTKNLLRRYSARSEFDWFALQSIVQVDDSVPRGKNSMQESPFKRTRLWIDPAFQSRLLIRLCWYLFFYWIVIWHVGFLFQLVPELLSSNLTKQFSGLYADYFKRQLPLLYALVLVMPIILRDLLKFSHRIAGPLFRCRKVMNEMASGKPVSEFKPRKHDLMVELFQAFNRLIKEWNRRNFPESSDRVNVNETGELETEEIRELPDNHAAAEPQQLKV
jgi:hypothetical protein